MNDRLDLDFGHNEINHDTSDDYYTPPFIFEALGVKFDMDVCAPPGGIPWIPAKRCLTIIEDGLVTPWIGTIWCNPPFSNISPWIEKMRSHGNGIGLVGISKSAWCNRAWQSADAVMILPSNLKFIRANGNVESILTATMLLGYGSLCSEAMIASKLGRVR
ncbi:MAG: hypothetical protein EBT78_18715 [Betaproteobacteria bacterium]|nr:hypothetical protein [Betaproteobacteria bacterium]